MAFQRAGRVEKAVLPLISIVLLVMVCPGCRRGTADVPDGTAGVAGPAGAAGGDGLAKQFEDGFRELKSRLERSPDPVSKKQLTLRTFIQQVKMAESSAGRKLGVVVESAEAELQKLIQGQEQEAEDVYRQLEEKVVAILDGPERDVDKAAKVLEEFPGQQFREGGPALASLEALKQKIKLYQDASIDAVARKFRAGNEDDPVLAIAILEGFDPAYDKTPFAEEIRVLIRENYARYAERRQGKEATGDSPAGAGGDEAKEEGKVEQPGKQGSGR